MKSSHTTKAEFLCLVSTLIGLVELLSSMKAVPVELGSTMKLRSAMELGLVMRWRTGQDGSATWVGDEDEDR